MSLEKKPLFCDQCCPTGPPEEYNLDHRQAEIFSKDTFTQDLNQPLGQINAPSVEWKKDIFSSLSQNLID